MQITFSWIVPFWELVKSFSYALRCHWCFYLLQVCSMIGRHGISVICLTWIHYCHVLLTSARIYSTHCLSSTLDDHCCLLFPSKELQGVNNVSIVAVLKVIHFCTSQFGEVNLNVCTWNAVSFNGNKMLFTTSIISLVALSCLPVMYCWASCNYFSVSSPLICGLFSVSNLYMFMILNITYATATMNISSMSHCVKRRLHSSCQDNITSLVKFQAAATPGPAQQTFLNVGWADSDF